ncbi:MAG: hypothetical protein MMC33_008929 [Icmadophila ericetorum]|nr:hypothetical protein [Icmadophila ericetorum]
MPNISFDIFFNQDIINITASRSQGAPKVKPDWKVRSAPKIAPKEIPTPTTAFGAKGTSSNPKNDSTITKKTPPKLGSSKKSVPTISNNANEVPNKNSQANGTAPKLSNGNVSKLSNGVPQKPKTTPSVQGAPSQTKKKIPKLEKK